MYKAVSESLRLIKSQLDHFIVVSGLNVNQMKSSLIIRVFLMD